MIPVPAAAPVDSVSRKKKSMDVVLVSVMIETTEGATSAATSAIEPSTKLAELESREKAAGVLVKFSLE